MSTYVKEVFYNDLYRVKHVSGTNASKSVNSAYHSYGKLLFLYYKKSGGSIIFDNARYDISDGDVFLVKPTEFYKHIIDGSDFHERIVLIISPHIFKNLPNNYSDILTPFLGRKNGEKNRIPRHLVNEYCLDRLFEELLEYSKEDSDIGRILAFTRALEILVNANKFVTTTTSTDSDNIIMNSKVDDILKYLNNNYTKDISITDVADRFHLNRSYLSRLFKEQIGMSMWDYVIMRRIYHFNFLISDSNSFEETAYRVGFKNYSNFYRLYKKYVQMTPTEFKKTISNPKRCF